MSVKTIKDVAFVGGPGQPFVAAGSDDGRLLVWERHTGARAAACAAAARAAAAASALPATHTCVHCDDDHTRARAIINARSTRPCCCVRPSPPGRLVTVLRADRYVVNGIADAPPGCPAAMVSCGIDTSIKLWSPCLSAPRDMGDRGLLTSLGYNELLRGAEAALYPGFSDMVAAFSKARCRELVTAYAAEQAAASRA